MAIVTSGLLLYLDAANPSSYPGSGSMWYDLSGNGRHVTLYGSPVYNAGGWLQFNETTAFGSRVDYGTFSTAGLPYGGSPWTVSAWVYNTGYDTDNGDNGWAISWGTMSENMGGVGSADVDRMMCVVGGASHLVKFQPRSRHKWICIVGVYDGTTLKVYGNGTTILNPVTCSLNFIQSKAYIGRMVNDLEYQVGHLSEILLYNRALSETEIYQNFYNTMGRYSTFMSPVPVHVATTPSIAPIVADGGLLSVNVVFSSPATLTGAQAVASNWTITPTSGGDPHCTAVSVAGGVVSLTTTAQVPGTTYTLTVPAGVVAVDPAAGSYGGGTLTFTGVGSSSVNLVSLSPGPGYVDLTFDKTLVPVYANAQLPASWGCSGGVQCTQVTQPSGAVIRVQLHEPTTGTTYTLSVPPAGIKQVSGELFAGPLTGTFTGQGIPPYIAAIQVIDSQTLRVTYSEPVNNSDALNTANYGVSPPLQVTGVSRETDSTYIISTAAQAAATTYTLTATNVRDLAGNPV